MKTGTILLLLLVVVVAAACAKMVPPTQELNNTQTGFGTNDTTTSLTDNSTLVIEDENLNTELTEDPLEEVGTLDEIPVDDSIPE